MSVGLHKKKLLAASKASNPSAAYQARIISDGAIAYWPLDDLSGTVAKDKVGTRHGTISGGVLLNQPGFHGSKSMTFNGTTGKITIPVIPSISVTGHTFEGWALFNGIPLQTGVIFCRQEFSVGCFTLRVGFAEAGSQRVACDYPAIANCNSDPAYAPLNVWCHCISTYDGTSIRIYINGTLGATIPATINDVSTATLPQIGQNVNVNDMTSLSIQDVAVYSRALSQSEISVHYALR